MTTIKTTVDDLGDRMKAYEQRGLSLSHVMPGETFIVRLDGKAFHTFTKGLKRPYDEELTKCMVETTKALVHEYGFDVGYTQSDEITLVYFSNVGDDLPFNGRVQKIVSLTAARATQVFNDEYKASLPNHIVKRAPIVDCRLFTVPTRYEAVNNLIWRQADATKNAISMAAQSMFKHAELQGKNGSEMQEMMFTEKGVNFNDYPFFFKRGTFVRREREFRPLDQKVIDILISKNLPIPASVERSVIKEFDCWITKAGTTMEQRFVTLFPNTSHYAK